MSGESVPRVMRAPPTAPLQPSPRDIAWTQDNDADPIAVRTRFSVGTTINGKSYPKTDPIRVQTGKRYRWTLDNQSADAHPIHLHRHRFELVRFDGQPVSGIWKDVVVVPAWKQVDVDVPAMQPGLSLFPLPSAVPHGHGLHGDDAQPRLTPDFAASARRELHGFLPAGAEYSAPNKPAPPETQTLTPKSNRSTGTAVAPDCRHTALKRFSGESRKP